MQRPAKKVLEQAQPPSTASPAAIPRSQPPIDLGALSARLNPAAIPLNEEQIREDQSLIARQVADAAKSLQDSKVDERIGGAEQLAAYPTREAERLLAEALQTDAEAEVRATAATSLDQVEHPKKTTISALFAALEDESEDVRIAALDTLVRHIQRLDADSSSYKKLIAQLEKKANSKRVPKGIREDIRAFLTDQ